MQGILTQITALLGVTVGAALIAKFLRQPIIVAYIFAGIVAGPLFLNLVHGEREIFHIFSQLGVILLLFMIGLSLNFNYLRRIGKVAVAGGLAQVIFTGVIGMGILRAMGFAFMPALYLAVAITFSSTIIITKLLSDKKDTDSLYGRHTVGLMLVQDLVAVLLMVFLTAQGGSMTISSSLIRLALGGMEKSAAVAARSRSSWRSTRIGRFRSPTRVSSAWRSAAWSLSSASRFWPDTYCRRSCAASRIPKNSFFSLPSRGASR